MAGHSPLGPSYGLGADVVVEYKIVTADGKLTVANEVSNPDLFWALRGGGGGTFGIVTEATVKAFRSPKMTLTTWFLNTTDFNDKKSMYKVYSPVALLYNMQLMVTYRPLRICTANSPISSIKAEYLDITTSFPMQ